MKRGLSITYASSGIGASLVERLHAANAQQSTPLAQGVGDEVRRG